MVYILNDTFFLSSNQFNFHQNLLCERRDHDDDAPNSTREESDYSDAWVTLEEEQLGLAKVNNTRVKKFRHLKCQLLLRTKDCSDLI